jgi:protein involved in polysaccharide export with SLBB domain
LQGLDSLVIYSTLDAEEKADVLIDGAVRQRIRIPFNPTLKLRDVIRLAGGVTKEAALNRIDVYRVDFDKEKRTRTLAAQLQLDENLLGSDAEYQIQPFDQIYVRKAPEYELQNTVILDGEIVYPGPYAMLKENTRLSDVINQAGGLTEESSVDNATLYRIKDSIGFIVINLKEALKNKGSFNDLILQDGDELFIPKRTTLVAIEGATNYRGIVHQENGLLNVAYEGEKSAHYYVDKYAAGFSQDADKKNVYVKHSNGKVDKVKSFLFFKSYPKVKEGSKIVVPYKKVDLNKKEREEKGVDWGDVLKDSITQATAILSLILLIQSVD